MRGVDCENTLLRRPGHAGRFASSPTTVFRRISFPLGESFLASRLRSSRALRIVRRSARTYTPAKSSRAGAWKSASQAKAVSRFGVRLKCSYREVLDPLRAPKRKSISLWEIPERLRYVLR